jgi:hypothetical protein
MGREFSLVKYHRNELVHDLLTWTGMRDLDRDTVAKAEEAKRKKAEAAAAKKKALAEKKAAEAKAAKDSKPKDGPDKSSEQSGEKN